MSTFPAEEIANLRQVVESGRAVFGGVFINEETFWVAMLKLRKALPNSKTAPTFVSASGEPIQIYKFLDELEQYIDNGKMRFLGMVWVETAPLLKKIDEVEALLKQGKFLTSNSTQILQDTSTEVINDGRKFEQPDQTIKNAQVEADRIIAEAKQEAERIIEQARRRAEEPWVMED